MSARAAKASKHEAGDSAPATVPEPEGAHGAAHHKHKKAHTTHASSPTGGSAGLAVVAPADDMEAAMAAPTPLQTSTDHVRRVHGGAGGTLSRPRVRCVPAYLPALSPSLLPCADGGQH